MNQSTNYGWIVSWPSIIGSSGRSEKDSHLQGENGYEDGWSCRGTGRINETNSCLLRLDQVCESVLSSAATDIMWQGRRCASQRTREESKSKCNWSMIKSKCKANVSGPCEDRKLILWEHKKRKIFLLSLFLKGLSVLCKVLPQLNCWEEKMHSDWWCKKCFHLVLFHLALTCGRLALPSSSPSFSPLAFLSAAGRLLVRYTFTLAVWFWMLSFIAHRKWNGHWPKGLG